MRAGQLARISFLQSRAAKPQENNTMADVCTKAISGNDVTAGRAVVGVLPNGNKQALASPTMPTVQQPADIEAQLTDRLDDKDYYEP
jgi:hypothetical protein